MAFIQRYQNMGASTFGDLVNRYIEKLFQLMPDGCRIIHFVGDRYDVDDSMSLKSDERHRRDKGTNMGPQYLPNEKLSLPEWKSFIQNPVNKANLLKFFSETLCKKRVTLIPPGFHFILGGTFEEPEKTVYLQTDSEITLQQLDCRKHEEADTRIMAHIAFSLQQFSSARIVVHATDTDIAILCIYHITHLGLTELWVQKQNSFLAIHQILLKLSQKLRKTGQDIAASLLGLYVLTGCDSVSYFFRRGKRAAAKLALQVAGSYKDFLNIGQTEVSLTQLTPSVVNDAIKLVAHLYGYPPFSNLDLLRQHMFATSKADCECSHL